MLKAVLPKLAHCACPAFNLPVKSLLRFPEAGACRCPGVDTSPESNRPPQSSHWHVCAGLDALYLTWLCIPCRCCNQHRQTSLQAATASPLPLSNCTCACGQPRNCFQLALSTSVCGSGLQAACAKTCSPSHLQPHNPSAAWTRPEAGTHQTRASFTSWPAGSGGWCPPGGRSLRAARCSAAEACGSMPGRGCGSEGPSG